MTQSVQEAFASALAWGGVNSACPLAESRGVGAGGATGRRQTSFIHGNALHPHEGASASTSPAATSSAWFDGLQEWLAGTASGARNFNTHLSGRGHGRRRSTSFYFDCRIPDELWLAYQQDSGKYLRNLPKKTRNRLLSWIDKKFNVCAYIRKLWDRRRITDDLPSDRGCINEWYQQGGQRHTPREPRSKLPSALPPFQGLVFFYDSRIRRWYKCCHIGRPASRHPLETKLRALTEPWMASTVMKQEDGESYIPNFNSLQCQVADDVASEPEETAQAPRPASQDPFRSREICLRLDRPGIYGNAVRYRNSQQCIQMGLDEDTRDFSGKTHLALLGQPLMYDYDSWKYRAERENYRVFFL